MSNNHNERFETIYRATFNILSKYVYFKVANISDVEDIIQNIYINFYTYIVKKNKEVDNVQSYLIQIANNELTKYYKSKKELPITFSDETNYIIENIQSDINIEHDLLNTFEPIKVFELVKELELIDQKIIGAHFRYEMTFNEIALSLHISENTVKTRYYRALKELKKLYELNIE